MDVTQTLSAPQTASPSLSQAQTESGISSDFETFLRMLTVQLENQDPLDPVKSEDFAVQLATFSGVEQQVLTNELLTSLTSQMSIGSMSQFASWVGMEALVPAGAKFNGAPITLAPKPDLTADRAELVVYNQNGAVVDRSQIDVSHELLEWTGSLQSGTAPNGVYSFEVESFKNGEVTSTYIVETYSRVVEARNVNGEVVLVMDGEAQVPTSHVSALRDGNA